MRTETLEFCARKRLEFELREYNEDPPANISFGPTSDEDMFQWQGIIFGPLDTPIEGQIFELSLKFPIDYPCKPPKVKFETQYQRKHITEHIHPSTKALTAISSDRLLKTGIGLNALFLV
ncbi:ubiquitin-conjugating enzyme E2 30-like isoform X2 [Rhododendron vialii]|uniref:ubiquitin-conjugating enzyme E2 30-like isoform X2 n=1 Tax=Rhododendron vialii TaxID=182163 RepID=UPI00265DED25|nr:ubiquitin-conjugating enzyme E2 30-like isoform X2 [Rhododendron vialii]